MMCFLMSTMTTFLVAIFLAHTFLSFFLFPTHTFILFFNFTFWTSSHKFIATFFFLHHIISSSLSSNLWNFLFPFQVLLSNFLTASHEIISSS